MLEPGDVELALTFIGGPDPEVVELALNAALRAGVHAGTTLDADPSSATLDGRPLEGPIRLDLLAEAVVNGLSDVSARAEAVPDGELVVKFPHGVQARLAPFAVLVVDGVAHGGPGALRLSAPLTLSVDGGGMQLSHQRFHRLSNLASVRIEGASLHPDGEVRLRGGASGVLDRVVQGGLERAGARLSDLVRRSPRFARVRNFLRSGS